MTVREAGRVGKPGTLVIPARLRKMYGLERKAEFLLSNAVDAEDYAGAVEAVRALGLDPEVIPHERPRDA